MSKSLRMYLPIPKNVTLQQRTNYEPSPLGTMMKFIFFIIHNIGHWWGCHKREHQTRTATDQPIGCDNRNRRLFGVDHKK